MNVLVQAWIVELNVFLSLIGAGMSIAKSVQILVVVSKQMTLPYAVTPRSGKISHAQKITKDAKLARWDNVLSSSGGEYKMERGWETKGQLKSPRTARLDWGGVLLGNKIGVTRPLSVNYRANTS